MLIDYPWYFVVLGLLVGALYAAVLYFVGKPRFGRGLKWLLAALRFVAVSAIVLLLLAPVSRRTVHERQQPRVVLLEDASLSVLSSADSALSLQTLYDELSGNYNVTFETFGDRHSTDIGEALLRHRYDDVAAIALATDGIYNRGGNPASLSERLTCPVYTVALGDTMRHRDAALTDLRVSRIALLGNDFPIEVTIGATLLGGRSATLSVTNAEGHQLHSQRIVYDGDDYGTTVSAMLHADKPGLQRYTVRLAPVDGEISIENNTLTFFVDIIDTRRRVAIVADAPHPDLAAMKHAIESNPAYQATVMMADDMQRQYNGLRDSNYSLTVLHNLPSKRHTDIGYADGLPTLFVIGLHTDLPRFNALHTGIEIMAKTERSNEVTAISQDAFGLFHLDGDDCEAVEAMPPLVAPFGEARLSADVQTLFTARVGPVDSRQPLVAASAQGEVRRAFVWGEGLWRWRLADWQANSSHDHFDRLMTQLVAFAAMQQQRERLRVEAQRSYVQGETPVVRAYLYNETYELTNTPDLTLTLQSDSTKGDYQFLRDGQAYRVALPDLPQGLYRYSVSSADGQKSDGSFAIEALNLEQRRLTADHNLLRTVSATTGGEMYYPNQLVELKEQISTLKPVIYTHTRYTELLRLPLVMALIVLLLAAEWVLRKYYGNE